MRVVILGLCGLMLFPVAQARPFIPKDPAEVVEQLPSRRLAWVPATAGTREDPSVTLEAVRSLLQMAQREGDPRYLGYAEARLAILPPSTESRLLRARLLQASHRFTEAQAELAVVLRADPTNTEAQLLQASIYQVQGHYALARQSCEHIVGLESLMLAIGCRAQVDGLNGKGRQALGQLQRLTALDAGLTPDQRAWGRLALGDLAWRLGNDALAGQAYASVSDVSPDTAAAYADWLLATGKPAQVVTLLRDRTRLDGLLLRLALAEQMLNLPQAREHRQALGERFAAQAARGDFVHLREESRYALELLGDRARALDLARRNWSQQREPADVMVYQRAALAAGSRRDLALLRDWLQTTHMEDSRLDRERPAS